LPESAEALPESAEALPESAEALPESAEALPESAEALPESAEALAKALFSVFFEKHRELQEPIFVGPVFGLNGNFWSVFGRFRAVPECHFTSLLRFSDFKCPSYRTF
jgi:hypothetical protein